MKDRYKALFPSYNNERCPNFLEDTIKLISLLDEKKLDLKELLEFIQNNLDYEKVNEIYIKLSDRYKLNNKTKEIIAGHFAINKNNNKPTTLVYLIKNCKNLRENICTKNNKYVVIEEDFLSKGRKWKFQTF